MVVQTNFCSGEWGRYLYPMVQRSENEIKHMIDGANKLYLNGGCRDVSGRIQARVLTMDL